MSSPLRIFESAHTMSVLLFVHEHPGCLKTDVYRGVSHNPSLPSKFDALEAAGLLIQDRYPGSTRLTLTDKGSRVAVLLGSIRDEIGKGDDA